MASERVKTMSTRAAAVASVALLSLFTGGCAGLGGLPASLAALSSADADKSVDPSDPRSDLVKATDYWGKEYGKNPTALEPALAYARNLKAMGEEKRALAVLQAVAVYHGDNKELAAEYGRLALSLGQVKVAEKVLAMADDPMKPDWRVVSARGTALAKQGRYQDSIPYFERALSLEPQHPSLLNNLAMAHAMAGDPAKAETLLRQAIDHGGDSKRMQQNLALVLGLQGRYEESTKVAAAVVPAQQAVADTAAMRKLVALDPVAPAMRGSNQETGAGDVWATAVASAQ